MIVAHGYTMDDLDRIARLAVTNPLTGLGRSNADADELYEAAWGAATEVLCRANDQPAVRDLLAVARRAVDDTRREINRHRGVARHSPWLGSYAAEGFLRYWINPTSGSPVEDRVVDTMAVRQVVAALTPRRRDALVMLAAHNGDVEAAGLADGRKAFAAAVVGARRSALELWHDGETPRPNRVEAWSSRTHRYPCGTRQAYRRHVRRREQPCEDCRQAHSAHMAAYHQNRRSS